MQAPSISQSQRKAAFEEFKTCKDKRNIPELFSAMPAEVQMDETILQMAFDNCTDPFRVQLLFEKMLDEMKTKDAVVNMALKKCVPELFEAMAAEVQMNETFAKMALEKCPSDVIPLLFRAIPAEVQMNEAVVKMALEKCPSDVIPLLFSAIPAEVQMNEDVVKMVWDKCDNYNVQTLFKSMPDEVKTKDAVVKMAFDKCVDYSVRTLFEAMPDEVKTKDAVVKAAVEKCAEGLIPDLFEACPPEVKSSDDVVKLFIKKCSKGEFHLLFEAMLDQVKPNAMPAELERLKEYVQFALDRMDALNIEALNNFLAVLPANLQDNEIKAAFAKKKVSQLPFFQKNQKVLWAAVKVGIIYLLFLGPIEGAIWFQRNAPGKIKDLSNQHWKNKTDFEEVHFEIFDGCVLSAALQPFDFALPLTALKLLVITAAFGFISRNLMAEQHNPEKKWKVWVAVIMIVYSVIMIPLSFISLVVHYVFEVSPQIHGGSFKKYECLYAFVNLAPFQTNYLMYLTQFYASLAVSVGAGLDVERVIYLIKDFFSRKFPRVANERLVQPLLDDDTTIGEMQELKVTGKFMVFSLTLAPYLCVEIPFIITHKVPAAACFFPFIIPIISVTGLVFAIVNKDFMRNLREQANSAGRSRCFHDWLKTVEEAGYLPIVPALWGLLVINEFLTLAPIYWYGGAGWFDSAMMVLVERSLYIYVKVFLTRIMTKFWSGVSLINELS